MRVAAVQFEPTHGPSSGSLPRLLPLVRQAARGSDLVVCPEMAATGYLFDDASAARRVAEPAQGPTFAALAPIARDEGCFIVCGFAERDEERLYNSAMLINPDGELAFVFRKLLLFEADVVWAQPGDNGVLIMELCGLRVSIGICMDLNNPAFTEWLAQARIDVLAFPTNWIDQGLDVHEYWMQRIAGTPTTLVAANRYGQERDTAFSGHSAVLSAQGVSALAPRRGDGVVRAQIIATVPTDR